MPCVIRGVCVPCAVKPYSRCAFIIKVKPNATLAKRTQFVQATTFFIFNIFFLYLIIIIAAADLSDNYCQQS